MSKQFNPGQRVRSKKPGVGDGTIVSKDADKTATQIAAPNTTYTVIWDAGSRESMVYPDELEAI